MSFPVARAVSAISVLGLLVASSATVFAADAQIRARITELRVNPAENAKAVVKLGKGREVSVLGKSGDGQWVKISTQLERADDLIKFEGWVDASAVTGDAIASAPTAKSNAKAEPASSNADLSWVTEEPAASAASDVAAGDNSWDNTPAPAAKPAASASSSDSWGSDTSTPAPAASSSAGEDWGTDSSSSGSSSSGSTDGW